MFKRRISQIVSLVILHSSWGPEAKWLCNPVLSCHSCPLAWFACPIGVFIHYSGYHIFPFLAAGMLLVVGALIGRMLCGWVCPFGFLMDMLYKIPGPKFGLPAWTGYIKYVVLVTTVFVLPFMWGEETLYSFCRVCPASALEVTVPNLVTGGFEGIEVSTVVKLGLLAGVLVLGVFSSRSFCKVFCPIGALLGPLNHISFWAIRPHAAQPCTACKKCDQVCPTNGRPLSRIAKGVPPNRAMDCVVCHDCQKVCPERPKRPAAPKQPGTAD